MYINVRSIWTFACFWNELIMAALKSFFCFIAKEGPSKKTSIGVDGNKG